MITEYRHLPNHHPHPRLSSGSEYSTTPAAAVTNWAPDPPPPPVVPPPPALCTGGSPRGIRTTITTVRVRAIGGHRRHHRSSPLRRLGVGSSVGGPTVGREGGGGLLLLISLSPGVVAGVLEPARSVPKRHKSAADLFQACLWPLIACECGMITI